MIFEKTGQPRGFAFISMNNLAEAKEIRLPSTRSTAGAGAGADTITAGARAAGVLPNASTGAGAGAEVGAVAGIAQLYFTPYGSG